MYGAEECLDQLQGQVMDTFNWIDVGQQIALKLSNIQIYYMVLVETKMTC